MSKVNYNGIQFDSELEVWKNIKGYEGLYQISNFGRVRSYDRIVTCYGGIRTVPGRIMTPPTDKDGYLRIGLVKNRHQKFFYVHRLVANAFLPNPNNYKSVNHIDENKKNNNADNLEWCTIRYNNLYNNKIYKLTASKYKPVIQYDKSMNKINEYSSIKEASEKTGIRGVIISRSCRCLNNKCKFIWRFKNA